METMDLGALRRTNGLKRGEFHSDIRGIKGRGYIMPLMRWAVAAAVGYDKLK